MKKPIFVNEPKEINGYKVVQDGNKIAEAINNNESVMHWENGNSMFPILKDSEYCLISPIKPEDVKIGDAVFCSFKWYDKWHVEVKDYYMVHRCTDIYERDGVKYFRIDGTDGTHFGWTPTVLGIATSTNIFQKIDAE